MFFQEFDKNADEKVYGALGAIYYLNPELLNLDAKIRLFPTPTDFFRANDANNFRLFLLNTGKPGY